MTNPTSPNGCIVCPVVRPDAEPRQPHNPPVCDGDRNLLDRWLTEIANLVAQLANPAPIESDRRRYERWGRDNTTGRDVSLGDTWADPLAAVGGVGPINSPSKQPSVSGSRERSIPIPVDAVDLTGVAREPNPTAAGRQHPDDQIGHLPAATTLDSWVRDWRASLWPDHHLPVATVDELVSWLRNRLWGACDQHPAIDEFATEIRALRGVLRRAAGETEPRPEPCDGVACARCDLRALTYNPADTYRAECSNCGTLYSQAEYDELTNAQAQNERSTRSPEEIHNLLRGNQRESVV